MQTASPPELKNSEVARTALRALRPLASRAVETETLTLRSSDDEVSVTLPADALRLLVEVLRQMADGGSVTVVPVHAQLTTQQSAELLNVSHAFLVALLDKGQLPFRQAGIHRRVRPFDLLAYQVRDAAERDAAERDAVLDELAAAAQELKLGY